MKHWIESIVLDIIMRMIAGKRYTSQERSDFQEQATNIFAFFGKLGASDALPFLRWMDIGGNERLMRKTAKEFDIVLQEWLDEHTMKRVSGQVKVR